MDYDPIQQKFTVYPEELREAVIEYIRKHQPGMASENELRFAYQHYVTNDRYDERMMVVPLVKYHIQL